LLDRTFLKNKKMNIYVGNLSFNATDEDLLAFFQKAGEVNSAKII